MKHVFRTALCTALMTAAVCVPTFAVKADAPVPARQGDFYVLANDQYVTFTDAVPPDREQPVLPAPLWPYSSSWAFLKAT